MPDLLTHYLTAKIITGKSKTKAISPFFLGVILPDVLSRVPWIAITNLFERYNCHLEWFLTIFHSPFVLIIACLLISLLFKETLRKSVFKLLMLGAALHLCLDMLQKNFAPTSGYLWFFPFSFRSFNIPLFWPDQALYFIPVLMIITIFIWWFRPDEEMVRKI